MKLSLAAARVNAGYKQGDAARLLGVTRTTLSNWENGKSDPRATNFIKMCKLYNVDGDEIFMPNRQPTVD